MTRKQRTLIAVLLLLLLLATAANYYLNLGFFPRFSRLLMTLVVLAISVLATRYRHIPDEIDRHKDKEKTERDA